MTITRSKSCDYGPVWQSETGRKEFRFPENPFRVMLWPLSQPDEFYCSFKMPYRVQIMEMFGPFPREREDYPRQEDVSAFMYIEIWR